MRKVVVEWMIEISHRANLRRETIFMGVHLFDTVMDKMKSVPTSSIQLVSIATMFIAAKY
jgi:hypothetical protein